MDFVVERRSYISMENRDSGYEIVNRMMKSKLTVNDTRCKEEWKKHKVLSRDVRKAEREAITLQDFEEG